jgi:DNA-binding GntR family transcriptional regulator
MPGTTAERIYEQLVDRIISGELRPGARVEEQAIASEFGVSRTPVRDALRQLAGTGLVKFRPNKGVTVVDLKLEELTEIFEALGEFEALCACLAAQRMTQLERAVLRNLHAEAAAAARAEDEDAYGELNNRLHQIIYDGTHNPSIAAVTENFRQRVMPFRAFAGTAQHRIHESHQEHDALVEAILSGDGMRSQEAMRNHVAKSSLTVLEMLRQRAAVERRSSEARKRARRA